MWFQGFLVSSSNHPSCCFNYFKLLVRWRKLFLRCKKSPNRELLMKIKTECGGAKRREEECTRCKASWEIIICCDRKIEKFFISCSCCVTKKRRILILTLRNSFKKNPQWCKVLFPFTSFFFFFFKFLEHCASTAAPVWLYEEAAQARLTNSTGTLSDIDCESNNCQVFNENFIFSEWSESGWIEM